MEKFSRSRQRYVLNRLIDAYPDTVDFLKEPEIDDAAPLIPDLAYLGELDLISARIDRYMDGSLSTMEASITARGIDFLADDGGLTAVLGVVTVRLHQDTVRDLLIAQVEGSNADSTVKGKLIDQLKALPAEGVGRLAEKALDAGLRAMPNVVQWLQTQPWN